MFDVFELNKKLVSELREIAKTVNVIHPEILKKEELIQKIMETELNSNDQEKSSDTNLLKKDTVEKPKRKRKVLEPELFIKSKPDNDEVIPAELMVEDIIPIHTESDELEISSKIETDDTKTEINDEVKEIETFSEVNPEKETVVESVPSTENQDNSETNESQESRAENGNENENSQENSRPQVKTLGVKTFNNNIIRKSYDKSYDFDGIVSTIGVIEIMPDGYGFLRSGDYNYLSSPMMFMFHNLR